MGAGGGLVAQGEPVWKPWRSRASLGKVGRKQLGWEERLWRKNMSCSGGAVWAAQGWASERLHR